MSNSRLSSMPYPEKKRQTIEEQSFTALCAGGGTRTRTTAKSLVFETNASTIPPLPLLVVLLPASRSRHFHAIKKSLANPLKCFQLPEAAANLDRFSKMRNKYLFLKKYSRTRIKSVAALAAVGVQLSRMGCMSCFID